jgi:carbon storage regulator
MLVLSRKPGESLQVGRDITITVVEIKGNRVRLGIDAPKDVAVVRTELANAIPRRADDQPEPEIVIEVA